MSSKTKLKTLAPFAVLSCLLGAMASGAVAIGAAVHAIGVVVDVERRDEAEGTSSQSLVVSTWRPSFVR